MNVGTSGTAADDDERCTAGPWDASLGAAQP